jgi:hypothetical protein
MIVKNLLVVGAVATMASAAAAQESKANIKVGAKIRVDNVQTTEESKPNGADKSTTKTSGINLKRAEINVTGEHGSDSLSIKYYLEGDQPHLRQATITHKFSDMVSATFGRMPLMAGSIENSYDSIDRYFDSMALGHMAGEHNGATVKLSFGDNHVSLQAVEGVRNISEETSNVEFEQKGGLTTGLQYKGDFGMARPILTYTMVKTASSKSKVQDGANATSTNYGNGYKTILGAGVQVDAGAVIDVEFDSVKEHKPKDVDGAKDKNTQSIIAQAKYAIGDTTPFLKIMHETMKQGAAKDSGDISSLTYGFGAEHKLDAACRLHALVKMANKTTKNNEGKDDKTNSTEFNLGVTASM